ncbi:MAG: family 43 glycosylhydrolase [Bacteroidetes bacterium]|nr:family 43 glycosylhydrolase [Bacteroidota bacterium]
MRSIMFSLLLIGCHIIPSRVHAQSPHFHSIPPGTFINPIFSGDYPDPSILVDSTNFYVVHSSFEYYPGLTIWHSKDLLHWTPVTSALTHYVGSVWAPELVKYGSKYYIYFPANGTIYVIVADSIQGPWSKPIDLKIGYIDPGHVVDEEGNRYLYFSNGSYVALTPNGTSVQGSVVHSYNGWPIPRDWSIECFCLEGPKLFKREEYYYLTVAQGGTAGPPTGHMVISARSKSPFGPWENSPFNPILRTENCTDRWLSIGHGTIFEIPSDNWWMIFHGYENGHYNRGRQTLLVPIEWTSNGWFKIPDSIHIAKPLPYPCKRVIPTTLSLSDTFEKTSLKPQWKFFGEYDTSRFYLTKNSLIIKGKGTSIAECSPLLCTPTDHSYIASVELYIEGGTTGGLVLFYSPKAYSGILADSLNILVNLRGWQFITEKNVIYRHVHLRLRNKNNIVDMYYSTDGNRWEKIENSTEVSAYHHNVLSDFLSLRIGLVAYGNGKVTFKNFHYEPIIK